MRQVLSLLRDHIESAILVTGILLGFAGSTLLKWGWSDILLALVVFIIVAFGMPLFTQWAKGA